MLSKRCLLRSMSHPVVDSSVQARLVRQEQQAIDVQYEKKRKDVETAQKMCVPYSHRSPLPWTDHFYIDLSHSALHVPLSTVRSPT